MNAALTLHLTAADWLSLLLNFMGLKLSSRLRDRKSTRLNSSHIEPSRMPSSA